MAINNLEHACILIEHNDDDDDAVQTETVQNSPKIGIRFVLNQLKCFDCSEFWMSIQ